MADTAALDVLPLQTLAAVPAVARFTPPAATSSVVDRVTDTP